MTRPTIISHLSTCQTDAHGPLPSNPFGSVLLVRKTRMAVAVLSEQTESLRFRVTHRELKP
ncbi:MAG: hypothetical protein ACJ76Y_16645 [Thermoanaerobaculia bacterium]